MKLDLFKKYVIPPHQSYTIHDLQNIIHKKKRQSPFFNPNSSSKSYLMENYSAKVSPNNSIVDKLQNSLITQRIQIQQVNKRFFNKDDNLNNNRRFISKQNNKKIVFNNQSITSSRKSKKISQKINENKLHTKFNKTHKHYQSSPTNISLFTLTKNQKYMNTKNLSHNIVNTNQNCSVQKLKKQQNKVKNKKRKLIQSQKIQNQQSNLLDIPKTPEQKYEIIVTPQTPVKIKSGINTINPEELEIFFDKTLHEISIKQIVDSPIEQLQQAINKIQLGLKYEYERLQNTKFIKQYIIEKKASTFVGELVDQLKVENKQFNDNITIKRNSIRYYQDQMIKIDSVHANENQLNIRNKIKKSSRITNLLTYSNSNIKSRSNISSSFKTELKDSPTQNSVKAKQNDVENFYGFSQRPPSLIYDQNSIQQTQQYQQVFEQKRNIKRHKQFTHINKQSRKSSKHIFSCIYQSVSKYERDNNNLKKEFQNYFLVEDQLSSIKKDKLNRLKNFLNKHHSLGNQELFRLIYQYQQFLEPKVNFDKIIYQDQFKGSRQNDLKIISEIISILNQSKSKQEQKNQTNREQSFNQSQMSFQIPYIQKQTSQQQSLEIEQKKIDKYTKFKQKNDHQNIKILKSNQDDSIFELVQRQMRDKIILHQTSEQSSLNKNTQILHPKKSMKIRYYK